jgi:hypothetical protein
MQRRDFLKAGVGTAAARSAGFPDASEKQMAF